MKIRTARVKGRVKKYSKAKHPREKTARFKGFLSEVETAKKLGVTISTLADWRHHGRGPSYVKPRILYVQSEVEAAALI